VLAGQGRLNEKLRLAEALGDNKLMIELLLISFLAIMALQSERPYETASAGAPDSQGGADKTPSAQQITYLQCYHSGWGSYYSVFIDRAKGIGGVNNGIGEPYRTGRLRSDEHYYYIDFSDTSYWLNRSTLEVNNTWYYHGERKFTVKHSCSIMQPPKKLL
jgi:hypothetical protein